ncbi:MAG TPA: hypothetical protein VLH37_05515 [Bacteroidales bacterium]|nr:hypothetical protein [Bacteroidales bacterium]
MTKKKPFVLRLHPDMMGAIEKWAADDFRSVNGQIEFLLHKALSENKRLKQNKGDSGAAAPKKDVSNGNGT